MWNREKIIVTRLRDSSLYIEIFHPIRIFSYYLAVPNSSLKRAPSITTQPMHLKSSARPSTVSIVVYRHNRRELDETRDKRNIQRGNVCETSLVTRKDERGTQKEMENKCDALQRKSKRVSEWTEVEGEKGNPGNAFANQSNLPPLSPDGARVSSKEPSVFPLYHIFFLISLFHVCLVLVPFFLFNLPGAVQSHRRRRAASRTRRRKGGGESGKRGKILWETSSVLARRDTTCKVGRI